MDAWVLIEALCLIAAIVFALIVAFNVTLARYSAVGFSLAFGWLAFLLEVFHRLG